MHRMRLGGGRGALSGGTHVTRLQFRGSRSKVLVKIQPAVPGETTMQQSGRWLLITLVILAIVLDTSVKAKEAAAAEAGYHAENFELRDDDLRDITVQVMAQNPLLSSSPGIKVAGATRHRHKHDVAELLYFPHLETARVKHAFQVTCSRQVPDLSWSCDEARIRRYVALDSQEFEVRVRGPLELDELMALIEATRRALPPSLQDGSAIPQTAIQIIPYRNGYLVFWGDEEGHSKLTMQARLSIGAESAKSAAWRANVYSPDD